MLLTQITCTSVKCPSGRPCLRLPDGGGLYLEVTAAGGKYWRLKYRFGGKEKRLAIGVFPTVGIADARREREAAKALLAQGIDPSASKKDRRLEARLNLGRTFESVARAWHSHWGHARSQRHADYVLRRLEADASYPSAYPAFVSLVLCPK